jgi:transposase-like protein
MDMTKSSAAHSRGKVVTIIHRRRRWIPERKLEIFKQTNESDGSDSMVARQFGITAAQLLGYSEVRRFETRTRRDPLPTTP